MLEKCAKALYEHWRDECELQSVEMAPWDRLGDKDTWRSRARAVLSSIEPTEEMVEAAARAINPDAWNPLVIPILPRRKTIQERARKSAKAALTAALGRLKD